VRAGAAVAAVAAGVESGGALTLLICATVLLQQVLIHGAVSMTAGNWPQPFGIQFTADRLGVALVLVAALMVTIAVLWQESDVDAAPSSPALHPLLHGLVAGANGAFLTPTFSTSTSGSRWR